MAGYSGTPLAKKLGIKEGSRIFLHEPPPDYRQLVDPLPAGARTVCRIDRDTDIVHIFARRAAALTRALRSALERLRPDAAIWVSWPKKAAKVPSDITEDVIREIALPLGLVDIKVCAVDQIWSGLKLVVRKENRATPGRGALSRRGAADS